MAPKASLKHRVDAIEDELNDLMRVQRSPHPYGPLVPAMFVQRALRALEDGRTADARMHLKEALSQGDAL